MCYFFERNFNKNSIGTYASDTWEWNYIFDISSKQAAKPSGSRYYECFYAAAAFVKVNINYTSKNFAVTCIYYLFIVQITYTHG